MVFKRRCKKTAKIIARTFKLLQEKPGDECLVRIALYNISFVTHYCIARYSGVIENIDPRRRSPTAALLLSDGIAG